MILSELLRTTCYIQFQNNAQLRAFMEEHEMQLYLGIADIDTFICCIDGETITCSDISQPFPVHHINDIQ